ncbi:STAS domain-containing protein [Spirochaetota bacterium]
MPDLEVTTEYLGADRTIAIIRAKGYIDTVTVPEIEKNIQQLLEQNKYKIIMDLKDINYVSSAGWGVFVSEIKDIRRNGGDFVLIGMSPDVHDVYELMEFSTILKAFPSIKEALENFQSSIVIESTYTDPGIGQTKEASAPSPASQGQSTSTEKEQQQVQLRDLSIDNKIKYIITKNPYISNKNIRKKLDTGEFGDENLGFWEMRKILKNLGLNSSNKRKEFADNNN